MRARCGLLAGIAVAAATVFADPGPAPPPPAPAPAAAQDESDGIGIVDPMELRIDAAVARGLAFLARRQQPCGGWLGDVGHKQMDGYLLFDARESQRERGSAHVGVTALAGLAFLADGQFTERGRFAAVVERTVHYVLSTQDEFGYFTDSGTRMYSHAFATLFLGELRGMTRSHAADVDAALRLATRFIENSQNGYGAWRYSPFTVEADLSVTVCQAQALRSARNVGIHVSPKCMERVIAYVRRSRIPSGELEGAFWYKIYGTAARTKSSYTINAAAVTTLHCAGLYDASLYEGAVRYVEDHYDALSAEYPDHFYYWYGNYYAAQALNQEGGRRWERFFAKIAADLLSRQRSDGSWANDVGPGDEFATAVACLVLRIPAQLLPIFQR